jgi:hypothetical protein
MQHVAIRSTPKIPHVHGNTETEAAGTCSSHCHPQGTPSHLAEIFEKPRIQCFGVSHDNKSKINSTVSTHFQLVYNSYALKLQFFFYHIKSVVQVKKM